MLRKSFLLLLLFSFLLPATARAELGSNLGGVQYWDGIVPFTNIVRQGGEWIGPLPAATDRNGWPTRLTSPVSMALAEVRYPAGAYRIYWRGQGQFRVGGKTFSGRNGGGQVQLDGSSLVLLEILQTSAEDHLRGIQVLVPGADRGSHFRSRYLQSLDPYQALRFMDWQRTNGTFADPVPQTTCKRAVQPSFISQGRRRGASVVWMVRLANRLQADPWFTVPHRADASWLRCHARYVARYLRRGLLPRYEYSNETWNPAFEQFHALLQAGVEHGLGSGDQYLGLQQEVARRHNWMARIVGRVMKSRGRAWRAVLAGQAANSWVLESRLQGAAARTQEIAVAPYMHLPGRNPFDPAEAADISSWSLPDLFSELHLSLPDEVGPWIDDHLALQDRYGKKLVAYEGGQHLAGDTGNEALTSLFIAANRHPDMGDLYDDYLQLWKTRTGDSLLMHFTDSGPYSRYGSWGALEAPDQDPNTSPKYQALLRYSP